MWWLGVLGFFVSARVASLVLEARERRKKWRATAERAGLEVGEPGLWSVFSRLTARSGEVEVRLSQGNEVLVTAKLQGPPDLAEVVVRRELVKLPLEIETGDEAFDRTFHVKGWPPFVLALLDDQVRFKLQQVGGEGELSLAGGELRLKLPEKELERVLPLFFELCQGLTRSRDVPRCLAENVRTDLSLGVRHRSLSVLIETYPGYPSTIEALRAASTDVEPQTRLRAARELGAEGRDVLLSLAENVDDDAVNAQAVAALGSALPFRRGMAILRRALRRGSTATAAACLEALGSHGSAVEPVLLEMLQREELQVAAAKALGRAGSVEAVLPLQQVAERAGLGSNLRRTANQAIAEIQARLAGADRGQLSLAGTEAGQLSLAADPEGRLSLPPEREG